MPIADPVRVLKPPDDEDVVWRFMSISKLVSMLNTSSLVFSQLRLVSARDPFESEWSEFDRKLARFVDSSEEAALKVYELAIEFEDWEFEDREDRIRVARNIYGRDALQEQTKNNLNHQYISCWYTGKYEPAGMWSIYASENDGIAIRSTAKRLKDALSKSDKQIHWGMVEYRDYSSDDVSIDRGSIFPSIYTKRVEYQHESELRLCIWNSRALAEGRASSGELPPVLKADCDLQELIQEIRVAPFAGEWVVEALVALLDKYGIRAPVRRSSVVQGS